VSIQVEPQLRVAVVGSGPSALYAVQALLDSEIPVSVDVFERLPAPYGLVRYGVAPDHAKMKNVIRVLCRPFERAEVRFIGNVTFGTDVTHDDLRNHFHAVVYATGMQVDRGVGVPGEDRFGSVGAARFVNWYCGHPDDGEVEYALDSAAVAVIGAGNVALDITRVLAKSPQEMERTDIPDRVLDALRGSRVQDIHLLIRRTPEHVKFTPVELREFGELVNADVLLHDHGFDTGPAEGAPEPVDRRVRQVLELLRGWARNQPTGKPRRVHMRFLRSPVEVFGDDRVRGIVVQRNEIDAGRVVPTPDRETLDVGMVISAVGYRAHPLRGLPFDPDSGGVPNVAGRVVDDGEAIPGAYVTGWLKRGPTGVIGTNKSDAAETVRALLEDLPMLKAPERPHPAQVLELLHERGVVHTDWAAWLRLDAEELRQGQARGSDRVKIAGLAAMLEAGRLAAEGGHEGSVTAGEERR